MKLYQCQVRLLESTGKSNVVFASCLSLFFKPQLQNIDLPYSPPSLSSIPYCPSRSSFNKRSILTLLSIPLGFLQLSLTPWYLSDWCLLKCFVRFLTMGMWAGIFAAIGAVVRCFAGIEKESLPTKSLTVEVLDGFAQN